MSHFLLSLAAKPAGRVMLHLVCVWRSHQWAWHLAGVLREIFQSNKP